MLQHVARRVSTHSALRRAISTTAVASDLPTGGFVTPAARHLIAANKLDGSKIPASGPGGRVLKADVLAFLGKLPPQAPWSPPHNRPQSAGPAPAGSTPAAAPAGGAPVAAATAVETAVEEFARAGGVYTDEKPSLTRSVIASRLTQSKATVPHFYVSIDCEIDAMLDMRKQLKAAGVAVSVNDMVIRGCALALNDVPQVNAFFNTTTGEVEANDSVDVCVAVATDGGLITPIVPNTNGLTLPQINAKIGDLATRARAGRLKPHEFQGGSFTVSNLGMFGIPMFSAVINPPQSAILAVGGGIKEFVFPNGDDTQPPVLVTRMSVQLSADRRVVDEASAAQFLQVLRQYLQTPLLL